MQIVSMPRRMGKTKWLIEILKLYWGNVPIIVATKEEKEYLLWSRDNIYVYSVDDILQKKHIWQWHKKFAIDNIEHVIWLLLWEDIILATNTNEINIFKQF